jgi:hypothetical protein
MRLVLTPRNCSANSPGEVIPSTVRRCAAWPATTPWHCATRSRTDGAPHPRKRMAEPSKGRQTTMPHPRKDNTVTSGRRDRSLPSPSALCGHPRRPQRHLGHGITITNNVGGWGDKTPPRRLLCAQRPPVSRTLEPMYGRQPNRRLLHRHPRSRSWMDTGHATTQCNIVPRAHSCWTYGPWPEPG